MPPTNWTRPRTYKDCLSYLNWKRKQLKRIADERSDCPERIRSLNHDLAVLDVLEASLNEAFADCREGVGA